MEGWLTRWVRYKLYVPPSLLMVPYDVASWRRPGAIVFNDIIFDECVSRPPIESQISIAAAIEAA